MNRIQLRLAMVAGLCLSSLSAAANAQSPSPFAVETNIKGIYAYTQPPAGFDPMTASAADLARYGYPPYPGPDATPQDLAIWKMQVNPALKRGIPQFERTNIYHRPLQAMKIDENAKKVSSSNWSGYALVHNKSSFKSASGAWIVPAVQPPFGGCSGDLASAEWVGIDGFSNDLLFQAGSEANAACSGGGTFYGPWVEWLPAAEFLFTPPGDGAFVPGDYIIVTVTASDWSHGESSTGSLVYTDVTQNWQESTGPFSAASIGGTFIRGTSAEWIVERPEIGASLSTLANYIADPWFQASATDRNNETYHPGSPKSAVAYDIMMVDNSQSPISFVDLFTNQVLWFFDEGSALN
jgi:hypothetical protein